MKKIENSYLFDLDTIEGFQDYRSEIWQDHHQNSKGYNAQCQHHQKAHPHIEKGEVLLIDHIQRKYADGIMGIFSTGKSKPIELKSIHVYKSEKSFSRIGCKKTFLMDWYFVNLRHTSTYIRVTKVVADHGFEFSG